MKTVFAFALPVLLLCSSALAQQPDPYKPDPNKLLFMLPYADAVTSSKVTLTSTTDPMQCSADCVLVTHIRKGTVGSLTQIVKANQNETVREYKNIEVQMRRWIETIQSTTKDVAQMTVSFEVTSKALNPTPDNNNGFLLVLYRGNAPSDARYFRRLKDHPCGVPKTQTFTFDVTVEDFAGVDGFTFTALSDGFEVGNCPM